MAESNRLQLRREKTRQSLIDAAKRLVQARVQKISIHDITDQANVGLGTFYNYFETKQYLYEAVLDQIKQSFNQRLNELRAPLKDPATIIAVTLKYSFEQAQDNAEWLQFVRDSGLEGEHLLFQDASQCKEDIRLGADGGRFKVSDVDFTSLLILGMVKHVTREVARGQLTRQAMTETIRSILCMLGLPYLVAGALTQGAPRSPTDSTEMHIPIIIPGEPTPVSHAISLSARAAPQAAQKRIIPKQTLIS